MLKKDVDDSSSEDDDKAVSTSSDDEESKMSDCGEKELPDKENDDNKDDNEETDEENNDRDEDTDDDCDEYTDTDDDYEGFAFLQNDVMCSIQDKAGIPMSWILLDIQSTVDVFSNKKLLTNIRTRNEHLPCTATPVRQLSLRKVT